MKRLIGLIAVLCGFATTLQAQMIFERGSVWRWRPGVEEASSPIAAWRGLEFNDAAFVPAPAPFWFGDPLPGGTQISGMRGVYRSIFLRKTFVVTNAAQVASLQLGAIVDDGFVAWINGIEVLRVGLPAGAALTIATLAGNAAEPVAFGSYELAQPRYLRTGTNVLAVQVFQSNLNSSDLAFDASLEAIPREVPPDLPPVVASLAPPAGTTVRELSELSILFSKAVSGVDAADLLANGVPATGVTAITPSQYLFRFAGLAAGPVAISWAAQHGIEDTETPAKAFAAAGWSYLVDPNAREPDPYLSEFMASNSRTLADEDGEYADWIEIYNPRTTAVNLEGWALTDSASDLLEWRFPATNLASGRFLVVFASEKNRRQAGAPLHANFKLSADGEYLALTRPDGTAASEFKPYPRQVRDVSFGFAQLGSAPGYVPSSNGVYFVRPTPREANDGGAEKPGPAILEVQHTPNVPGENDELAVTARVAPSFYSVAGVTLRYRVMFGTEVSLAMLDDGAHRDGAANDGVYGAAIPAGASSAGQMVRYFIAAADATGQGSRWPLFTQATGMAQYLGTVVAPDYVTSAIPVIHLFAPPNILQPGPNTSATGADSQGGSSGVSVFYDGEFYDNIHVALRGNTTAGYPKKSHRFEFNREHPFRHPGVGFGWPETPGPRIRRTSFVADYPDPTYMRQGLSFWLCQQAGVPSTFYYPVRLQLNGQFYQLANHNDVHTEELLERLGYDPNGALYNAVGTVQPSQFSTGGFEKKSREWEGNSDYLQLANAISESQPLAARRVNAFEMLDLPNVIDYLVAARFAQENDDVWANMSLYHDNDGDNLWRATPFDMNLSWGAFFMDNGANDSGIQAANDNHKSFPLYGSSQALSLTTGNYNRIYDVIFDVPETLEMFRRRMRSVLDQFVLPPDAAPGSSPVEKKILAWRDLIVAEGARDRAKWGWPGIGGQNNLPPGSSVTGGVNDLLQQFFYPRRRHFYGKHSVTNTALAVGTSKAQNAGFPLAQPAGSVVTVAAVEFNPASGNQDQEYVCLTNAAALALDISGWRLEGAVQFAFAPGTVVPARSSVYVSPDVRAFRARAASPKGREGRFVVGPYSGQLSARGETITIRNAAGAIIHTNAYAGAPSLAQQFLRVTEIMYHPPAPAGSTFPAEDFEFLRLKNISTNTSLSLAGIRFVNGVTFDFGGAAGSLAPGGSLVLARNPAAYREWNGTGETVSGPFGGALDNSGERLRLIDNSGEEILDFEYNNAWYPETDGAGASLLVTDERAEPDAWSLKAQWRASGAEARTVFVQHPLSQAVLAGDAVVLSVEVTNSAALPIHYVVHRNGSVLPESGQTLDSHLAFYTIADAQPAFAEYRFAVSGPNVPLIFSETAVLTFGADADGDRLPDDWEARFGFLTNAPSGFFDADADGLSNAAEYASGTDPTDAASGLRALVAEGGIEFMAMPSRTYTLEFTGELGGPWEKLADFPARAAAGRQRIPGPGASTNRFYRLATPRRP